MFYVNIRLLADPSIWLILVDKTNYYYQNFKTRPSLCGSHFLQPVDLS